jgi:predicted alpha/beta hydrolase family esterase
MSMAPTLLLIPGLRDEAPGHWQAILASQCPGAVSLPALGRRNIDLAARLVQIEEAVQAIKGLWWWLRTAAAPLPQHIGPSAPTPPSTEPCWRRRRCSRPAGARVSGSGRFPAPRLGAIPRSPLPFRCIVAASRNDPLGAYEGVSELARDWGASLFDLGESGHLNPASGFGPWPTALDLVRELALPAPIPMN